MTYLVLTSLGRSRFQLVNPILFQFCHFEVNLKMSCLIKVMVVAFKIFASIRLLIILFPTFPHSHI